MKMPKPEDRLSWVHQAKDVEDLARRYDAWAEDYEKDLASYGGKRMVAVFSKMVQRFLKPGEGPVLDAGAGTGKLGDLISPLGYNDLVGIDISEKMLAVARTKGLYRELRKMALGERLGFSDDTFAHFVVTVVLRGVHTPPEAFDELIRVTRPGGYGIFAVSDAAQAKDSLFLRRQDALEIEGKWKLVDASDLYEGGDLRHGGGVYKSFVYQVS